MNFHYWILGKNQFLLDMAKPTGHLLKRLRQLMKNTNYVSEAISAYIIPSGDSHQVNLNLSCKTTNNVFLVSSF